MGFASPAQPHGLEQSFCRQQHGQEQKGLFSPDKDGSMCPFEAGWQGVTSV